MADKQEHKAKKRVVVEEVVPHEDVKPEPKISDEAAKDVAPSVTESIIETNVPELKKETETIEPRKSPSIALWIIVPGIFILGAILGGIVFYQKGVNKGEDVNATPSASPTASTLPSASPLASEDLTKYTITILNGSGIAGEAGKAKTLLTTDGFKVGSTGNAATYDYTKTIIKAKRTVDAAYISALSAALGKSYDVDSSQTLATSSADTVQVIIGSSKAQ